MSHLTYPEAIVVGLFQGVSELFPVSSLGHSVLIPALIGGRWARDLNVSTPESPYLAFIVGLHVATAIALLVYFRRDWVRIIGGLFVSVRTRRVETAEQRLAWLLVLATIPVGLTGLVLEHTFRTTLGRPIPAAIFLTVNGLILFGGERLRKRESASDAELDNSPEASDARISRLGFGEGTAVGAAQILALLPGISRSGVTMVAGLVRGLSHEDAARFSFLLATPVIFAAGILKVPDLAGPLGNGIRGQILVGSALSGIGAYLAVRYLVRYFQTRTLTPFAIYCSVAGLGSLAWLTLR
jgi:undecaprenyl-diphosphatase